MPEIRNTGRRRRSVGFPALSLLLLAALVAAIIWAITELFPALRLPF